MVWTVWSAFDQFRKNVVDLDPDQTKKARSSRDYLFEQIKGLARKNAQFPKIVSDYPFNDFGSFARKTKIQPLDDIDFLIILNIDVENREVEKAYDNPYTYNLRFTKPNVYLLSSLPSMTLERFSDNGYINSNKILYCIRDNLSSISNYRYANIKKTMQAVTLNLKSYSWVYDIVPAIPVKIYYYEHSNYPKSVISHFLIPNGYGQWIATDPRIDADNTTRVNSKHDGKFLPTLRLLKYWNSRINKPLSSYYFETLAIKVFEKAPKISDFPHAIKYFFDRCPYHIREFCPDPKNLGPNLDAHINWSDREKVIKAMNDTSRYAEYALNHESNSNYKEAIRFWQHIFGSNFPNYG
ncbi:MAG: hypothetical protein RLZZ338_1769 [Cyanobacteriota bacterium]|jgi:hypothetical protein